MKSFFHKYKFILFLAVFWVAMSLAGFLGQNTVYAGYSVDVRTTPYFVLVLQGIHDHIFPWSGSADDNLEPIAVQQYPKEHIRMTEPGQEAAPSEPFRRWGTITLTTPSLSAIRERRGLTCTAVWTMLPFTRRWA